MIWSLLFRVSPYLFASVLSIAVWSYGSHKWNSYLKQKARIEVLEKEVAAREIELADWQNAYQEQQDKYAEIKDIESNLRQELAKDRAWAGKREQDHRRKEETIEILKTNLNQCRIDTLSLRK